jgi:hypothetical protein
MTDTKASEIIVQAFNEGGFQPRGKISLAEEMQDALPILNSLILTLLGLELGEQYRDWPVPPNRQSSVPSRYPLGPIDTQPPEKVWSNPPANVRLVAANAEAVTVYFPANPVDGARMAYADSGATADVTLHGNGRLIQGSPSIVGAGGHRKWLYRADLSNWICIGPLEMHDTLPLPPEFDELFICGLVIRLGGRFKQPADPMYRERYADMLRRLKKRYKQTEEQPTSEDFRYMTISQQPYTVREI